MACAGETIGERRRSAAQRKYGSRQSKPCKLGPTPLKANDYWMRPWIQPCRISKRANRPDAYTCDSTAIAAWLKSIFVAVSWKTLSASAPSSGNCFRYRVTREPIVVRAGLSGCAIGLSKQLENEERPAKRRAPNSRALGSYQQLVPVSVTRFTREAERGWRAN